MSSLRATISLALSFSGFLLLSGGVGFGPCGGSVDTWKPTPGVEFIVMVIGLETIVGSYFLVKQNRSEGNFRMLVYFVLFSLVVGFIFPIVYSPGLVSGVDRYFVLLSLVAVLNLVWFWKRVGVGKAPRNLDLDDPSPTEFTKAMLLWDFIVLGPATLLLLAKVIELEDPTMFAIWTFVLGAASVEVVFLLSRANLPRVRTTSALSGAAIMIVGGLILANVFGEFEPSASAWSMGMILAAPSAIASGVIARALN